MLSGFKKYAPLFIAAHLKISVESANLIVSKLIRAGKLKIGGVQAA